MVSIPLADQHVQRFVWRNCETEKDPDTYVKTVLTFGDRPAPAMATAAMRKTATLKEDTKPRAAEAIKDNAYVDDICDSVCTVDEAKVLTSDIDEVLGSGGFHIKNGRLMHQSMKGKTLIPKMFSEQHGYPKKTNCRSRLRLILQMR